MAQNEWQRRITRAEQLVAEHRFAAEILRFYASVARFQEDVLRRTRKRKLRGLALKGIRLRRRSHQSCLANWANCSPWSNRMVRNRFGRRRALCGIAAMIPNSEG